MSDVFRDHHEDLLVIERKSLDAAQMAQRCWCNPDKATLNDPNSFQETVVDELESALELARRVHASLCADNPA